VKLALIAPIAELRTFTHSDEIHLVLPHLLNMPGYGGFYFEQSKAGHSVILDNSAYEMTARHPEALLEEAMSVLADEIVVPDALNDCEATLELAGRTFTSWAKGLSAKYIHLHQPQLMLVPQGQNLDEWRTCLYGLILRWQRFVRGNPELQQPEQATIGLAVPATRRVGLATELLLENWLYNLYDNYGYEIHLLGVKSLWQLNQLARDYPWIRSTDTVKPIVHALQGVMLDPLHEAEPAYPGRPADYFERTLNEHQREIARYNVAVTYRLAKGQYKKDVVGV
jgi:hypothetical protein